MNARDQFRASLAVPRARRFLDEYLMSGEDREAIETLIEIVESAATPPKPESNVTHFYREF